MSSSGSSFPTTAGEGLVAIPAVLERLRFLDHRVNLSVEDHGGSFKTRIFDEGFLPRVPDLTARELARLMALAQAGGERARQGYMRITERADWPAICEARTRTGLANVKRLVEELEEDDP